LISKYFPERARLTPNIAFLCSALCFSVIFLEWLKAQQGKRVYAALVLLLCAGLGAHGFHSLSTQLPIWSQVANTDRIRLLTYSQLESNLKAEPGASAHVSFCPPVFDAFWGVRSFRKWQAIPEGAKFTIDGVNEETSAFPDIDAAKDNEFSCALRFPDFVETPEEGSVIAPVLKLMRQGKVKGSPSLAVRAYFPLRGEMRACLGVISYHEAIDSKGHALKSRWFDVTIDRLVRDGLTEFRPTPSSPRPDLRFAVVSPEGQSAPFISSEIDKPFFIKSLRRKQDLAGFLMVEANPLDINALKDFFDIRLKCGL
jgi:hypothetical protein